MSDIKEFENKMSKTVGFLTECYHARHRVSTRADVKKVERKEQFGRRMTEMSHRKKPEEKFLPALD